MKAIHIHEFGDPETLRYEEVPLPEPGEGEARVKIEAAEAHRLLASRQTAGKLLLVP